MVLALSRLAPRVQSNLGLIRGGIARGMSSQQIQGMIRLTGQAGLRRTDLLAGIRHARGIAESGSRIRNTRLDRLPDPSRIEPGKGPMISRFSYDVRVAPKGWRSGDKTERYVTVRSDKNLRPGDILQEAQRAIDEAPEDSDSEQLRGDKDLTVVGARKRA